MENRPAQSFSAWRPVPHDFRNLSCKPLVCEQIRRSLCCEWVDLRRAKGYPDPARRQDYLIARGAGGCMAFGLKTGPAQIVQQNRFSESRQKS